MMAQQRGGVPAGAQEDGFDARACCERMDAGLEVALQQVHAQAVLRVRGGHKVQDLWEVILSWEEEGCHASQAWEDMHYICVGSRMQAMEDGMVPLVPIPGWALAVLSALPFDSC